MATTVKELREWLEDVDESRRVAVDDGGLTLVLIDKDADREDWDYFEIGGIPEEDEEEG